MEVKNQRVRRGRLSRLPIVLLLVICSAIVLAAFISMQNDRSEERERDARSEALFAEARDHIERMRAQSRLSASREEQEPEGEKVPAALPPIVTHEPRGLTTLEAMELYERLNGMNQNAAGGPEPEDPHAVLKAQREQAFYQALSSSSAVELNFGGGSGSAGTGGGVTVSSTTAGGSALTAAQQAELARGRQQLADLKAQGGGELAAYNALSSGDDHALPYRTESVDTPYIIRQGALVPAVLLTGINSDIPGQVTAQTTAPVYDSPLGNYELIPKGSRLVGQYMSSPAYGAERLMLAFNRIIFPDGKSLTLGAMPAAAQDGYAGMDADVDNHMFRLLSGALLLGGITAMVSVSQDDVYDDDGNMTVSGAMTQAVGASLGQVLAQVVERNLNIAPTLKVQPGYEFNLTLVKDLRFDGPYQAFDYAQ